MNAITRSLCAFWHSSIGKKLVVAITGIAMVLFLAGHLTGNLLIFSGADAFNDYAKFLHELGHGKAIWIARAGLLPMVILHVVATIQLTRQNRSAGDKYVNEATVQASKSSQIMIWSGLTILAFIVYHLLHFTVRATNAELAALASSGDVYGMVIKGFQNFFVSLFYVIAITCLCSHLAHGVASIFQTLGLRTKKSAMAIDIFSKAYSAVIWIGFVSIPVAIFFGYGSSHFN